MHTRILMRAPLRSRPGWRLWMYSQNWWAVDLLIANPGTLDQTPEGFDSTSGVAARDGVSVYKNNLRTGTKYES